MYNVYSQQQLSVSHFSYIVDLLLLNVTPSSVDLLDCVLRVPIALESSI